MFLTLFWWLFDVLLMFDCFWKCLVVFRMFFLYCFIVLWCMLNGCLKLFGIFLKLLWWLFDALLMVVWRLFWCYVAATSPLRRRYVVTLLRRRRSEEEDNWRSFDYWFDALLIFFWDSFDGFFTRFWWMFEGLLGYFSRLCGNSRTPRIYLRLTDRGSAPRKKGGKPFKELVKIHSRICSFFKSVFSELLKMLGSILEGFWELKGL